jgi:hypothetical protein
VQVLPDGKFVRCHILLQQAACRRNRRHAILTNATRFGG